MISVYDPFWPATAMFDFWVKCYVESAVRMGL